MEPAALAHLPVVRRRLGAEGVGRGQTRQGEGPDAPQIDIRLKLEAKPAKVSRTAQNDMHESE